MVRGMATLAGEAVEGAPDSAVAAALLALNAIFVIAHPEEPRESPALRFVRQPADDLRGGGLVQRILIPGPPDGAALERAAVLPSAPPLALVAVTVAFSGEKCSRARIALAGLRGRPHRVLDAEALVERTAADEEAIERAATEAARLAEVPEDGDEASTSYRRHLVRVLTRRALRRALEQARDATKRPRPRARDPALRAGPAPPRLLHVGTGGAQRQRSAAAGRGRGPHDPRRPAAARGPARRQGCVRHWRMRGLHGPPRRTARVRLPDPGGAGARAQRADHRRPDRPPGQHRHPRRLRRAGSGAVRVLLPRQGARRPGPPRRQPRAHGRGRPGRHRGLPLPVHRPRARGRGRARRGLPKGTRLIQDRGKLATGRAAFAADLDPAGILHAVAVGAPQAGARLLSADVTAARSLPGIVAAFTALDEPGLLGAVGRYAGAPLAVVAAEDRELAERAALALAIEVEPEGASFDVQTSPAVAWAEVHEGDPDLAFSTCDRVVEGTWRWPFASPPSLEPTATRAWVDEDGRLVLRATTAAPFALRARVARDLGLPAAGIRVVRPQVGAPFGALPEPRAASLCAALALRTGRPVSLVEEFRREVGPPEAAHLVRLRTGFRAGRLAAIDALLVVNLGALTDEPGAAFAPASFLLRSTGAAFRLDARAVLTGLPPVSDARLQATRALRFALEGAADEAARATGRGALCRLARPVEAPAVAFRDPAGQWRRQASDLVSGAVTSASVPVRRGRGVAVAGPWSQAGASATAALTSNPDGSIVLRLGAGGVPAGAGEALVDEAARGVGAAPERVSAVGTDTDSAPAQEPGAVEPWLLARAVREAAERLRADSAPAGRKKTRATAEATVTLGAEDLPAARRGRPGRRRGRRGDRPRPRGAARAGAPRGRRGRPSPPGRRGSSWPRCLSCSGPPPCPPRSMRRRSSAWSRRGRQPAPLPDLLPAAVAAIAHAFRDATAVVVREVPVRPERFLKEPEGTVTRYAAAAASKGGRLVAGFALRGMKASGYGLADLRADLMAGAVVGVVALPLSMALAIASGVPPEHGLYTAIVAGALIPLLGGSRVQVSGPTAAFVVVLSPVAHTLRHRGPPPGLAPGRAPAHRHGGGPHGPPHRVRALSRHHRVHRRHRGGDRPPAGARPPRLDRRGDARALPRAPGRPGAGPAHRPLAGHR